MHSERRRRIQQKRRARLYIVFVYWLLLIYFEKRKGVSKFLRPVCRLSIQPITILCVCERGDLIFELSVACLWNGIIHAVHGFPRKFYQFVLLHQKFHDHTLSASKKRNFVEIFPIAVVIVEVVTVAAAAAVLFFGAFNRFNTNSLDCHKLFIMNHGRFVI